MTILSCAIDGYPFDNQSQVTLAAISTWMGVRFLINFHIMEFWLIDNSKMFHRIFSLKLINNIRF